MGLKIAIIGLGYVGLPLAHAFSEKYSVVDEVTKSTWTVKTLSS